MDRKLTGTLRILLGTLALTLLLGNTVKAENDPVTVPEWFDYLFDSKTGNYDQTRTYGNQLNLIFGVTEFPERQDDRDSKRMIRLYEDVLRQQTTGDRTIRTQDLPNPFDGSIRELLNF